MAKQRRNYTREFKAEAVRRIAAAGQEPRRGRSRTRPGREPLEELESGPRRPGRAGLPRQGQPPAADEELRRLRAENHQLRMERDILKKATAFFARESS